MTSKINKLYFVKANTLNKKMVKIQIIHCPFDHNNNCDEVTELPLAEPLSLENKIYKFFSRFSNDTPKKLDYTIILLLRLLCQF